MYGFLAVLVLCGVASIDAYPFSAFKLFSSLRTDERVSWEIVGVDADGDEETIELGELPAGYRTTTIVLRHFPSMEPAERDDVCEAWADGARAGGLEVEFVRVYERARTLRPDAPPAQRRLRWECGS